MRGWGKRAVIVALASAAALAAAGTDSRAAFRGANGEIAFSSNRTGQPEIVVAAADGTNRVSLNAPGSSPKWSPDGTRIAFGSSRDGNNEIYVMNADGTGQTRLTSNADFDSRPQWTADGKQLVFTRVLPPFNWEIFRMNADGTQQTDLTNSDAIEWGQATSPQANVIAFTREDGGVGHIYTMRTDGRGLRQMTSGNAYDSFPNWSPRGNLILFTRDTDATGQSSALWVVRPDGSGERQLTAQNASNYILNGSWSPDGSKIIYTTCATGGSTPCALHVMNADGSGDVEISTPRAPFTESFDGTLDRGFWHVISDPGGTIGAVGGRLVASISGSAVPGGQWNQVDEHIGSNCTLDGDFDYQVDYALLTWPPFGGVYAQLSAFFADGGVGRTSGPWNPPYNQQYGSWIAPNGGSLNTLDTSGTLRLVRKAGTLSAYVRSSSLPGWTLINWGSAPNPTVLGMGLWAPGDQFAHQDAAVAFDDFRLSSGAFTCPSWWNDSNADWQPLPGSTNSP